MHADGHGLYLRVQAKGSKSWIFRFQLNGKRREMGIGAVEHVSPVQARSIAVQLTALVRSGVDPIEARKQEKVEAKAQSVTFAVAAQAYIAAHRAGWKDETNEKQWTHSLVAYAHPTIGDKPVAEVGIEDVLAILQPLWAVKTETASRVRSRIELILSYAKAMKWRTGENPAMWRGNLDALLPTPNKVQKVKHHPALHHAQMPAFMAALRQRDGVSAHALEFALLTCHTFRRSASGTMA
jgi:integrase